MHRQAYDYILSGRSPYSISSRKILFCMKNSFLKGNFANGSLFVDTIRHNLLQSCSDIKDVSVSIVDALAPPDFALNSVLGKSDGLVI